MAQLSRKRKPRRKGDTADRAKQTKKQIAFSRKETRQNRIIWLSVGALVLIIVIILLVGLAREFIVKPGAPVATVNGVKIRADDYQDLVTYRRYNLHLNQLNLQNSLDSLDPTQQENDFLTSFYEQQLTQLQSVLALAPQDALDELIDDELIRQRAEEARLTVTEDEVEQTIDEDLRRAASPSQQAVLTDTEPIQTPIPQEQLDEIYQSILNNMGLTDKAFRGIVQRSLLREKLQELLASQVVTTGLVVHVQIIETDTEQEALDAKQRVESGEDFAIVAQEISTDTLSAENGGDLGWVTTGQLSARYGENLETMAFSLEVGEIGMVDSNGQFFVVLVLERDENGPLPEDVLLQRQNAALANWLTERKESPDVLIERLLAPDQIPPDPFAAASGLPLASGP